MKKLSMIGLLACFAHASWDSALALGESKESPKSGVFPVIQAEAFNKFALGGDRTSPTESYGYMLGALGLELRAVGESGVIQVGFGGAGAGLAYDSTRKNGDNLGYNYIGYNQGYDGKGEATTTNTRNYYVHNAYLSIAQSAGSGSYDLSLGRFFYDDGSYIASLVEGGKIRYESNSSYDTAPSNFYTELAAISSTALLGDGFFWDYNRVYTPRGLISAKLGFSHSFEKSLLDISAFYYYGISEYSAPGLALEYQTNPYASSSSGFNASTKLNAVFPIYDRLYIQVPVLLNGFLRNENGREEGFTSTILLKQDFDFYKERSSYNLALAVQQNVGFSHARLGLFGSPLGVNIWDNSVYASGPSLNALVYKDAFSALFFTKANFAKTILGYKSQYGIGLDGRYTTAPAADEYSLKLTMDISFSQLLTLSLIANYYTSIYRHDSIFASTPSQNIAPNTAINRSYVMTKLSFDF